MDSIFRGATYTRGRLICEYIRYREASLLQHNSTRAQWDMIRDLNGRLRQQAFDNYREASLLQHKWIGGLRLKEPPAERSVDTGLSQSATGAEHQSSYSSSFNSDFDIILHNIPVFSMQSFPVKLFCFSVYIHFVPKKLRTVCTGIPGFHFLGIQRQVAVYYNTFYANRYVEFAAIFPGKDNYADSSFDLHGNSQPSWSKQLSELAFHPWRTVRRVKKLRIKNYLS